MKPTLPLSISILYNNRSDQVYKSKQVIDSHRFKFAMKHQQVIPDYAAMVQTSGTMLCLVFSGWVLFRLVQAVFWLPGYLEKTGGSLYQKMEPKAGPIPGQKDATQKATKAKDSDDETVDDDAIDSSKIAEEEKGGEDSVEREELPTGSKKDN